MSKAIRCDRCGKYDDDISSCSKLKKEDINFGMFNERWCPDEIDLCGDCTKVLIRFIKDWFKNV